MILLPPPDGPLRAFDRPCELRKTAWTNVIGFASNCSAGIPSNADFVQDRPVIVVYDQKVAPFFSHGSGPIGADFSLKRYLRGGLVA